MEKELLEKLIGENLSTRQIAQRVGKGQTTIKHWLKKYELKTNYNRYNRYGKKEYGEYKFCPKCHKDCLISDFYNKKNKPNGYSYCKNCLNNVTIERQRKLKKQCVEYKGGKCICCDYSYYDGAMEFHHLDPLSKDFEISRAKNKSFNDIRYELDKCVLLCSRCHREVEGGVRTLP